MRLLQIVLQRPSQRSGGVEVGGAKQGRVLANWALSGAAQSSEHLW